MSESFREGGSEDAYSLEPEQILETKDRLDEIDHLLAQLVEKGGDLSPSTKQAIRNEVQNLMASLGLKSMEALAAYIEAFHEKLDERLKNPRTPSQYPSKEEFEKRYLELLGRSDEDLPRVWSRLTTSDVAKYGQLDWSKLQGRTRDIVTETYHLGRVMCDEIVYRENFDTTDNIVVDHDWHVENGRHRALALRLLGERFVTANGMNKWVKIQKED